MIIVLKVEFSSFYFQEYVKICKDFKILSVKNFQLLYMVVTSSEWMQGVCDKCTI